MKWWTRAAFALAARQRAVAEHRRRLVGTRRRPVFGDPFIESECRNPEGHDAIMVSLARQVDELPGSTHTR